MDSFNNKRILIVGASSGIGAKTATVLGESGASLILVARREDLLCKLCKTIGKSKSCYYAADISDIPKIEELINEIVIENGKLDGVVYAAGITDDVPLKFLDYDRLLKTFNTNYFAFVELIRQISNRSNYNPGMRVVAISSVSSIKGEKAHTAYCASKAAIDATVRCLSKELYNKGIVLNSIQPGMIKTAMYDEFLIKHGDDGTANQALAVSQYAGVGEPEDVANVIAFLLSSKSKFITGVSIPVDGGSSTT